MTILPNKTIAFLRLAFAAGSLCLLTCSCSERAKVASLVGVWDIEGWSEGMDQRMLLTLKADHSGSVHLIHTKTDFSTGASKSSSEDIPLTWTNNEESITITSEGESDTSRILALSSSQLILEHPNGASMTYKRVD